MKRVCEIAYLQSQEVTCVSYLKKMPVHFKEYEMCILEEDAMDASRSKMSSQVGRKAHESFSAQELCFRLQSGSSHGFHIVI